MRQKVPVLERVIGGFVLLLTVAVAATFVIVARQPSPPLFQIQPGNENSTPNRHPLIARRTTLPGVELPEWSSPTNVRIFTPDNLWEKIDGRADLYLSFHMVRMRFGTYRHSRDPERFVDVYWYDMGATDNAFGIYRAEMGSHPDRIDIGRGAYAPPGGVFFWKGNDYVRVETADATDELASAATAIARTIARAIVDEGKPLWAEALLPAGDRVTGSFEYHATDAFSLDFLDDTFSADYNVGDRAFKTFIHRAKDATEAKQVFEAYTAFFREFGSVIKRESQNDVPLLVGESGGTTDAVFLIRRYVGGVNGSADAALAEQRAAAFAQSLQER